MRLTGFSPVWLMRVGLLSIHTNQNHPSVCRPNMKAHTVNKPSPTPFRTSASGPPTPFTNRFSSLHSFWNRAELQKITSSRPARDVSVTGVSNDAADHAPRRSWYISPYCLARSAKLFTGTSGSTSRTLPKSGIVGGCGIGVVIELEVVGSNI